MTTPLFRAEALAQQAAAADGAPLLSARPVARRLMAVACLLAAMLASVLAWMPAPVPPEGAAPSMAEWLWQRLRYR